MKIWLDGKRIFEEETDYGSKYYVFPRDKMQKNVSLHGYIVKKGNLTSLANGFMPMTYRKQNVL